MSLSILNDSTRDVTAKQFARFAAERVFERAHDPADPEMIALGNQSFGVLNLSWQAADKAAEWAERVRAEVDEIRERIRETHGAYPRFVIWAGMGGSVEDKTAYNLCGLLKGGPRLYSLDSTDPEKLKSIVDDMQHRAQQPLAQLLPATLVVGMAMGMTSYEPVVNLEKLAGLYEKFGIDSRPNFIYMTLPGSVLDRFAEPKGYRRIPLQLDDANTTAGRHSAPLTRGSLYPLALAGRDLKEWISGAVLTAEEIDEAFKLAAFLQAQGEAGRDKVTLLLPKFWAGAAIWSKQDVEESLGKSEKIGIKLVVGERLNIRICRAVDDPKQDRVFLAVQRRGEPHPEGTGITSLRTHRYPMAILTFGAKSTLSRYMQFLHYVVFALGYLRKMNFVTQPAVELYKSIAAEILEQGKAAGGVLETEAWKQVSGGRKWRGAITGETPETLAQAIRANRFSYGELTFFGDMRYSEEGQAMRRTLNLAAQTLFRSRLKMPADVYEGPAMNHSYHEMIIGHGNCFSIVVLSRKQARFAVARYDPDYHVAQFLATKLALERKHRTVRAILVKDLSGDSLTALEALFRETADSL